MSANIIILIKQDRYNLPEMKCIFMLHCSYNEVSNVVALVQAPTWHQIIYSRHNGASGSVYICFHKTEFQPVLLTKVFF